MFNKIEKKFKKISNEGAWGAGRETHPITRRNTLLRHEVEQQRELQRQLQKVRSFSSW